MKTKRPKHNHLVFCFRCDLLLAYFDRFSHVPAVDVRRLSETIVDYHWKNEHPGKTVPGHKRAGDLLRERPGLVVVKK